MSFARHSTQTILVRITVMLLLLFSGIITARWLGTSGEGVLSLLILLKTFAFRFGNLGFGSAFAFFLARDKIQPSDAFRKAICMGLLLSTLSALVFLAIWKLPFSQWNDISGGLFYMGLLMIPLFLLNNYFIRILSGQLRITAINVSELLLNSCNLVFLFIFVIVLDWKLAGGVLALLLADLFTCVYLFSRAAKKEAVSLNSENPIKKMPTKELWQYGRWNYLVLLVNFLTEELPLMLLKSLSMDNSSVGLFHKARGLGRQTRVIAIPISQVLFPYTAASKEKSAVDRTNILCRNSLIAMVFVLAVAAVLIKPVILFLYGSQFSYSIKIFYLLIPGFLFWPMGHFLGVHLAASGKPHMVFWGGLCTVILGVLVSVFFISRYQANGAAASASMIFSLQAFIRLLIYRKVTSTGLMQVLIPRRKDLKHYREFMLTIPAIMDKYTRRKSDEDSSGI